MPTNKEELDIEVDTKKEQLNIQIQSDFYKSQNYKTHTFYKPITRLININEPKLDTE
jgi:hypothetical protein